MSGRGVVEYERPNAEAEASGSDGQVQEIESSRREHYGCLE